MNRLALAVVCCCCFAARASAAEPKPKPPPPRGLDMEYGPFLCYSVLAPGAPAKAPPKPKNGEPAAGEVWQPDELIAARGITVKVGEGAAAVCFDADTMRYAAGWMDGFLDITRSHLANEKGSLPPNAAGTLAFTTADGPGFAKGGAFDDPRKNRVGPLPKDWAHFKGFYRCGQQVVFAYTVGSVDVLDEPAFRGDARRPVFARTLWVDKSDAPLTLKVCDAPGGNADATGADACLSVAQDGTMTYAAVHGLADARLRADGKSVELVIPPHAKPVEFCVLFGRAPADNVNVARWLPQLADPQGSITRLIHGGPALWPDVVETRGSLGADKDAYTVDTVGLPDKNPWHAWIRPTALDFFPDGRCAICTWNGDVWIASNLNGPLGHVQWRRFAAGLYDPLGIKVTDGHVYVLARDGIIKLVDLDGDGEADFYEVVNNDRPVAPHYNGFAMDLVTDAGGSFYYAVAGNAAAPDDPYHADLLRVSKDGSYLEEVATGLRTANGLGVGPHDEITVSDNQGNWVPTSPIFLVRPGAFYNFAGDPHKYTKRQMDAVLAAHPRREEPICWIPYQWDNSAGGQVWAGDRFGPLSGHMLHTSYGKGTIFAVLTEQVDGAWQGAVEQLPLRFDSGIQRARVSPADGQVWVAGLHGWQTAGAKDGCLQRVRYTGKPLYLPTELHVRPNGFAITFPVELEAEAAQDSGSYSIEQWVYHITEAYGSDAYKASDPNVKGHDVVDVKKVTLSADRKTVLLEVSKIEPVEQYVVTMSLAAADGKAIRCALGGTINRVPGVGK